VRPATGWPVSEAPRPCYPDRVEWDGSSPWEVIDVDVLGRWLIVSDGDEHYEERYVDPAELYLLEVYDARPLVGCEDITSMAYAFRRAMETALATYKDALVQQLEQPSVLMRYLQRD
jgi:hypothetical protein